MAKKQFNERIEKIADGVVCCYQKIENGVVSGYKKIENGVVGSFTKISDKFVDAFLTREGETVGDARERLSQEQAAREKSV